MKSIDLGFILIFCDINPKSSVNISQAFMLEKEIFPLVAEYIVITTIFALMI
jgi:hypothetical protein